MRAAITMPSPMRAPRRESIGQQRLDSTTFTLRGSLRSLLALTEPL
jgi:hypothetical protein